MTALVEPLQRDDELLADIAAGQATGDDHLRLWWLGQSGFLVQWAGHHLLLDPYLSDSLTLKYADTDKPHVRLTARAVDPAALDMIDVVTSSHNHTDHLDHETLWPLLAANPAMTLVIPEANRAFVAERLKTSPHWPIGLTHGESLVAGGFRITALAVAHEQLDTDELGRHLHLGYLVAAGPFLLFHSGDAVPYEGMADELLRLAEGRRLDVILLPINGRLPERRVPGNFWGDEAATFAHTVGARLVVPMHYEMFAFNTETPDLFVSTAAAVGQPYRLLRCGELLILRSPATPHTACAAAGRSSAGASSLAPSRKEQPR
jgi:L-ascorbate metabolism protein UlaG (beta-lactamase superfamily)